MSAKSKSADGKAVVPPSPAHKFFAACPPGLENWLAYELREIGERPALDEGGCTFEGGLETLYRANLRLRIASRVLARVAEFSAEHFSQLEKRAAAIPWDQLLSNGCAIRVEAVCYRSKLYHEKAVAERIEKILVQKIGARPPAENETPQLVLVRIVADECTVSLDSSGELLHKRGYRQELTKATLRETLAAALIAYSGWDRRTALLDPFCGSGTIAIEAAMLARNISPGRNRKFAFMDWPEFDRPLWEKLLVEAGKQTIAECPPIFASDRDAGAVEIAKANAARAGVLENIEIAHRALKAAATPPGPLFIVTNPPYGHRLEGGGDLRNLYAALGNFVRARNETRLTFISSNPRWTGHTGLRFEIGPRLSNGSIPIRFARALPTPAPDDRKLAAEANRRGLENGGLLIVVDVEKQEARVWQNGRKIRTYVVSTSRRGVGNRDGSNLSPPGWHEIAERIGADKPLGSVFRARKHTGRIVPEKEWKAAREAGDLILSRILWLRGLEDGVNCGPDIDSHERYIYFHGTIHEELLGRPSSAGCVRMANREIVELFDLIGPHQALVWIG